LKDKERDGTLTRLLKAHNCSGVIFNWAMSSICGKTAKLFGRYYCIFQIRSTMQEHVWSISTEEIHDHYLGSISKMDQSQ